MNLKGSLPALILQTLARGERHGYDIAREIKLKSDGVLAFREGTLYPTLHTLERQGLVTSSEMVEQGRTRRYYRLTDGGRARLAEEREEWLRLSTAIGGILGGTL